MGRTGGSESRPRWFFWVLYAMVLTAMFACGAVIGARLDLNPYTTGSIAAGVIVLRVTYQAVRGNFYEKVVGPMTDHLSQSEPWGHKLTVVVYVRGEQINAEQAAEVLTEQIILPEPCEFMGMSIEPVQNRPADQVGS